jgi:tetratricopeptide (TPR) repeat protein
MAPAQKEPNQIRVFISSTFRDMGEDRNYLVKFIFPVLRKLCDSRGVRWSEVDLRWGVTEEESAERGALEVCLEEIRRCRPYFIGMLGERYGFVPPVIPAGLKPVRTQDNQCSITELEIIHGVLGAEQMHARAFFYFRDPAYPECVPTDRRRDFEAEDEPSAARLKRLKCEIRHARDSGICRLREPYRNPQELGEWILLDFTELIENLFPDDRQYDAVDRERAEHEAFARSRLLAYVGRQEYFDRLDQHLVSDARALAVIGESGIGKSALLANWLERYRSVNPGTFSLIHCIGSTPDSSNPARLLRRIMLELKLRYPRHLPDDPPIEAPEVYGRFPEWLARATAAENRVVLVLDGLNQIGSTEAAQDLGWLPATFPPGCRVIVSTLPGRGLEAIRRRQWPEMEVKPLTVTERAELIAKFLGQFGKKLQSREIERIATAGQTSNPLFLRAMLGELRQFGERARVGERISHYLGAGTPEELFGRVLVRWEDDYEGDTDLVGDALSLLWAARRGLSESELKLLLGGAESPCPQARWSPLYLAMSDALVVNEGLITFGHQYLRDAVQEAYLPSEDHRRKIHRRLALFFASSGTITDRKIDEETWQCWRAEAWDDMHDSLINLDLFVAMRERGESTINYWRSLPARFDPTQSYLHAWGQQCAKESSRGMRELSIACHLGAFFLHYPQLLSAEPFLWEAKRIADEVIPSFATGVPMSKAVLAGYTSLARYLRDASQIGEAEAMFRKALALAESSFREDEVVIASIASDLGWLLSLTRRAPEAEALISRALSIWEKDVNDFSLEAAKTFTTLGIMRHKQNRLSEGEALLSRALAITEGVLGHDHPNVALCLASLGGVVHACGRYADAEAIFARAVHILEESGYADGVEMAVALNNLAQLLQQLNRYDEAEPISRKQLTILARWSKKTGHRHVYLDASAQNYKDILEHMGFGSVAIERRLRSILNSPEPLIHEGRVL